MGELYSAKYAESDQRTSPTIPDKSCPTIDSFSTP